MNLVTLITIAATMCSAAYILYLSKPQSSKRAIARWEKTFDIEAHGQRYQGARAQPLVNFFSEKTGIISYRHKTLYKTPSGRFFEVELQCELGSIVAWNLDIISNEDATAFLSLIGYEQKIEAGSPTPTRH